MKTFSRLSLFTLVCFGLALMFSTSDADAQRLGLNYEINPAKARYEKDDKVRLTFTLTEDGEAAVGEQLKIISTGVTVILSPSNSGVTDANGQVTMTVQVGLTPPRTVRATWPELNNPYAEADFDYHDRPEKPILVVLPPDPKTTIVVGDTFTQTIAIRNVADLSAWQMDVVFNPNILELVDATEGDFLESGGYNAFFQRSSVADSNAAGRIRLSQGRIGRKPNASPPPNNVLTKPSPAGVSIKKGAGNGNLVTLTFKVLEFAEEPLGIHNVQLSNSKAQRISYSILVTDLIVVTNKFPAEDVNRDGNVDVRDLIMVANDMGTANSNLGRAKPINPRTDVNGDGFVNMLDLIAVSSSSSWAGPVTTRKVKGANEASLAAPTASVGGLTPAAIQGWIDLAQVEDDGSAIFDLGIANLEALLAYRIPSKTRLLLNYPNPFNPETWIPYQLSESTDVTVTIHSMNGSLIRTLELGHQAAGAYQSKSQAAYWDGRNELGEQVASGLYFYTLTAGNFSATGKMLVRK